MESITHCNLLTEISSAFQGRSFLIVRTIHFIQPGFKKTALWAVVM